jgi:hypothetical protein
MDSLDRKARKVQMPNSRYHEKDRRVHLENLAIREIMADQVRRNVTREYC